jgi:hypothetical protein
MTIRSNEVVWRSRWPPVGAAAMALCTLLILFASSCRRIEPPELRGGQVYGLSSSGRHCGIPPAVRERLVVDLHLGDDLNPRVATAADSAAVIMHGGVVHHAFNLPVLRVEIDAAELPALLHDLDVEKGIHVVRDPDSRQLNIQINYDGAVRDEDMERLRRIGVQGTKTMRALVSATVHDSLIPTIRRMPYVISVRPMSLVCIVTTPVR